MDLFEDDGPEAAGANAPEFTVTEISGAVKRVVEGEFGFVRVRGEVGRVSRPSSGHLYLDLKDDRSVLASVIWKGTASKLSHRPEEGMEVVATGRLTTFPGQSRYQMVIEDIRPAGAGALMAMLDARRKKLEAEGLFAAERKRPLPFLPEVIGVVTSPSGAVIRDILHRLRDRFPRKVLLWPVAVQGPACAPEVARAIDGFNRLSPGGPLPRPDLLIVARGGGSIEDLWGFNEEIVARAAAASVIPLISAVGHETDTTLIDWVSDCRAPTPTAAAEIAVPVRLELVAAVDGLGSRAARALGQGVASRQQRLRDLGRALPRAEALTSGPAQRLDHLASRLPAALRASVARREVALARLQLSPGTLSRAVQAERRQFETCATRLAPALARAAASRRETLDRCGPRLAPALVRRLRDARVALAPAAARLVPDLIERRTAALRQRFDAFDRLLETLSYHGTLARGFAVVRGDGQVVTRLAGAEAAGSLEIEFHDGRLRIGGRTPSKRPKEPPPEQGTLL